MANNLQYGFNLPASDIKKMLERNSITQQGVRYWNQQFGKSGLGYNTQSDALTSYYSDAMAKAYTSNLQQQNQIYGAGLNVGTTQDLLKDSALDLQSTYDKYMSSYQSNLTDVTNAYLEEVGAIDATLTTNATNLSKLYNNAYDYLANELYGSSYMKKNLDKPIFGKDEQGKKIITGYEPEVLDYLTENKLDWLTEVREDTGERLLKSKDALSRIMFDKNTGELTDYGREFYDKIFNTRTEGYLRESGESTRVFGNWLSDVDNDLYNWWVGENPSSYFGTNVGISKEVLGLDPTKQAVAPTDYMRGSDLDPYDFLTTKETNIFETNLNRLNETFTELEKNLESVGKMSTGPRSNKGYAETSIKTSLKKVAKEAVEAEAVYTENMNQNIIELSDTLKRTMGTELYDDFMSQNASLYKVLSEDISTKNQALFDELVTDKASMGAVKYGTTKSFDTYTKQAKDFIKTYQNSVTARKKAYQTLLSNAKKYVDEHRTVKSD